jgi:Transglutaminase-like superfamily
MREYRLPQHVFVSPLEETCIWLDTRVDRFRGTSQRECRGLSALVEGWPAEGDVLVSASQATAEARAFAETLVRQGLLTRDLKRGKTAASSPLESPKRSLYQGSTERMRINWQHVVRFLAAYCMTVVTFKLGSLRLALATVAKRKASCKRELANRNLEETRELVGIFMRLRSRAYTAKRKCLFDSLTLAHFLTAHSIFTELVIGVSESPFRAHSWLQQGDAVLNFDFEYVKEFCPVAII